MGGGELTVLKKSEKSGPLGKTSTLDRSELTGWGGTHSFFKKVSSRSHSVKQILYTVPN